MHLHPLQKLHIKAANDNEIGKENFVWRILKITVFKKKLSDLKGWSISHLDIMYCFLHF